MPACVRARNCFTSSNDAAPDVVANERRSGAAEATTRALDDADDGVATKTRDVTRRNSTEEERENE
jgi:hypothetical protein